MDYIETRLPHKYPVRFIKEVEVEGEEHAVSWVEFEDKPTLPALVEAAAQNIIFIQSLHREFDGGVLTSMKNVTLLKPLTAGVYRVESSIDSRLDPFATIQFVFRHEDEVLAKGEMSVVMNPRAENLLGT